MIFFYLIMLIYVSIMDVFPFVFSFTAGLPNSVDVVKPGIHLWPAKPLWGNYLNAWKRFAMSRLFVNTIIAASGGVLAQITVSSLAADSLSRLNPRDLYEAAQMDGASEIIVFTRITLPLSSSVLLVLRLFAFIGFWGEFLWPFLIPCQSELQPISVRLYTLRRGFPLNLYMAASFIAMIPPSLAAFYLQQHAPKSGLTF